MATNQQRDKQHNLFKRQQVFICVQLTLCWDSVKTVDDVEEVAGLVWRYKTRRQTFEDLLNCVTDEWRVSDGSHKEKDLSQVWHEFSWL